jgi:hypothetical protein
VQVSHCCWGKTRRRAVVSSALVRSVTKLASITFLSLVLSPTGSIYLGFTTEGRLAAVLIIPSLGVPNWSVIYIYQHRTINKFSGAVAGEEEDFCKGRLSCTIFTLFCFILFLLASFYQKYEKKSFLYSCFFYFILVLLE